MRGGDNDGGDNVVKGGGYDGEDVDDTLPSGVGASVSTESSSSRTTSRASQQRRDCNLSGILIVTVIMFLIFHSPRF